jgi:hypothetical protein
LRSIAAQNTSHAFPYAAYGGYKKLNELSFLNGNSMTQGMQRQYRTKEVSYE